MFRRDRNEQERQNFWISYADLMAGLLFVFILLIGAIVSKSILLRENLHKQESRLQAASKELEQKRRKLRLSRERLARLEAQLKKQQAALARQRARLAEQNRTIRTQDRSLRRAEEKIRLQADEVRKLHLLLADLKTRLAQEHNRTLLLGAALHDLNTTAREQRAQIRTLQKALREKEDLITLSQKELKLRQKDLERLNRILLARNATIDRLNKRLVILQNLSGESNATLAQKIKELERSQSKILVLSKELTRKEDELRLKDARINELLEALDRQKSRYEDLLRRIRKDRARIKTLTGIRLKVIAALKKTLGDRIRIDRKTGALRLSSKILFDRGSATLKEEAKKELRETFERYIAALMSNEAIRPYLERIVIEGHTDSDGGYLYNLRLSQQRALAVMNYLLSLPIAKRYDLKKYLVASGRAYMDPILRNGVEDKNASRRIEIKFRLKNREAMYEIERILDGDQNGLF
ncbi:OmpA family protein [Nitratifractor sp.]